MSDILFRILFIILFAFMSISAVMNYRGGWCKKAIVGILSIAGCAFMYYIIFYLTPSGR